MSQAGVINNSGGGGGGTVSHITSDNLEITNPTGPTVDIEDLRFPTAFVVDPSGTLGDKAPYQTITAAVAAASGAGGGVVLVRDGTYVESFTLPAQVSLTAFQSAPNVFGAALNACIDGTITFSAAGESSITGIALQNSSGGPCLHFTGSSMGILFVYSCTILAGSVAAIQGSNTSAIPQLNNCFILSGSGDYVLSTGTSFNFSNCQFQPVAGGINPALTCSTSSSASINLYQCLVSGQVILSDGNCDMFYTKLGNAVTSGATGLSATYCDFQTDDPTLVPLVCGSTQSCNLSMCSIEANGQTGITIASGCIVLADYLTLNIPSGPTYAISQAGAGNAGGITYGEIVFANQVSGIQPTIAVQQQILFPISTAVASGMQTLAGHSYYNSADFVVDSTGFVSLAATIGVLPWTDQGSSTTVGENTGSFSTAAITLTLPESPPQGTIAAFAVDNAGALILVAGNAQFIRLGTAISSSNGTATSTNQGDSITLVFRTADNTWIATSSIGMWGLA
jgi:hypothetical protein